MKEVFYSELLKKYFDTKDECLKREDEYTKAHEAELKAKEEKKALAKEVEEAYKDYIEKRTKFIDKYGSWHATYTADDFPFKTLTSFFDLF